MSDAPAKAPPKTGLPYKIGADTWSEVVLPSSLEERYELLAAWHGAEETPERHRVFAAALALCWPLLRDHMRVNGGATFNGRVLAYGRMVMDALLANSDPASRSVVLAAGKEALEAVSNSLYPIMEAAKDPEDFGSAGGSGGPAGSSLPSSDGLTSSPAPSETSAPS